jgi:hypothetical protein
MPPMNIEIPDELFSRIQSHAKPFVDLTPAAVIQRWADHFDKVQPPQDGPAGPSERAPHDDIERFDPLRPPDLFHTRVRGTFGTAAFLTWNELVRIAHIAAFAKAGSFAELRSITQARVREGRHSDSGFHYVPEIGVSIQGMDANHAWSCAIGLAKYLGTPVRATIEWRHNPKAAKPGARGVLEWAPMKV